MGRGGSEVCGSVELFLSPSHPHPSPLLQPPLYPPARSSYLVGLEIIIQGKLQFAQILWLFLFLSFTLSLSQASLCVVIILWGLGKRMGELRGERTEPGQCRASGKPAPPCRP